MAKALTVLALGKFKPDQSKRREIPDGLLTGLYFVVQPSGARSWAVRYRAGGKPRKLTLGSYPTLELDDARNEAKDALQRAQRGDDPAAEKVEARRSRGDTSEAERLRFDSIARRYLARDARSNRSWLETARLLGLVPPAGGSDDPKDFVAVPSGIVNRWGNRSITEIKRSEIIELLDSIVDRGAPIVANRTLAALRRLFNWAIERGLIEHSVCAAVKAPSAENSRDRVLTDVEVRWLWKAAEAAAYPFGRVAQLLLLTGQRRDEVADMTTSEVDSGVWTIPAIRAKNNQQHAVPLSEAAIDVMKTMPTIAGRKGLMFTTNGERPVSGWSRAKANLDAAMLAIAREETGDSKLEITPWTFHDLRRTAASGMARLGQPVHVVERLLNHRSGSIRGVAAVYNRHDYWAERKTAAEAWGRYVTALVSGFEESNVVALRG